MINTRVHGNGYIQMDIGPGMRLNVWVEGLPYQTVSSGIHNHTFSFESTVLVGALENREHALKAGSDYQVYRAVTREGEDTRLMLDAARGAVDAPVVSRAVIRAGSRYYFPFGLFHSVDPAEYPTVTMMRKLDVGAYPDPLVLCASGEQPDNGFSRYQIEEDRLDILVMKALKGLWI